MRGALLGAILRPRSGGAAKGSRSRAEGCQLLPFAATRGRCAAVREGESSALQKKEW